MKFSSLSLSSPLLQAIEELGYTELSPIQSQAIPIILQGRDLLAAAQTGTGKTAGFALPLLESLSKGTPAQGNQARALILTPTRELAAQVANSVQNYARHLPLRTGVVFGGVKINPQMMRLRKGVDVLVATPGRLIDLYQQNAVRFSSLEVLILDEADRMLDMGFINDIKKIIRWLPVKRQNLLFSATFSKEISVLAKGLLNNPLEVRIAAPNATSELVKQWIHPVDKKRKPELLQHLITSKRWEQVLVFTKTKHCANRLTRFLDSSGIKAAAIHGNKSQSARTKALADLKNRTIQVLVATDIAARGLDIQQLPQVVNFDLPTIAEDYVHRIGRTGRAGSPGHAISLVSADEIDQLGDIEKLTKLTLRRVCEEGFEPNHELPDIQPKRAYKSKPAPTRNKRPIKKR